MTHDADNVERTLKQLAREIASELDRLITGAIEIGDPEDTDKLTTFLWDNKIGLLRITKALAQDA